MESMEVVAVGVGGPDSSYSVAYVVGAALSACAV